MGGRIRKLKFEISDLRFPRVCGGRGFEIQAFRFESESKSVVAPDAKRGHWVERIGNWERVF
jgi:hypothetical protein